MKKGLRILFYVIMCACVCLFLRRVHEIKTSTYSFPNRDVTIVKIELIHNKNPNGQGTDESNFTILKELSPSEIAMFMSSVYELDVKQFGPPPLWGYGTYVARVIYENGDIEMFGTNNITFIEHGTESEGYGDYYFTPPDFENLFKQFADISAE